MFTCGCHGKSLNPDLVDLVIVRSRSDFQSIQRRGNSLIVRTRSLILGRLLRSTCRSELVCLFLVYVLHTIEEDFIICLMFLHYQARANSPLDVYCCSVTCVHLSSLHRLWGPSLTVGYLAAPPLSSHVYHSKCPDKFNSLYSWNPLCSDLSNVTVSLAHARFAALLSQLVGIEGFAQRLHMGVGAVILIDPPWEEYERRAPGVPTESWPWQDIMNLKIEDIADTPSFVFLWWVPLQFRP
eukprot:6445336-Pyramimonas_sp.AAC.1